jgi:pimeloyl-ACP methyl ester carboxylesterase
MISNAWSTEQGATFQGRLVGVIAKEDSQDRNDIYLKLESTTGDKEVYFVDDFFITFIIEQTYKVLLSDYVDRDVTSLGINLKLTKIAVAEGKVNGRSAVFIRSIERIFPNFLRSEDSYLYRELNPGQPKADFHHRYLEVPLTYRNPSKGTFKLYYELCSDFDESKPTILIPTDGQRTFSQVGWADKYKKMFNLDFNTVIYEYRGMYCSRIPELEGKNINWPLAYELLNSDNVVEDIERIRRDLLGDKKINILGGSGTAMIGLKYIAKYPEKVNRAFLMSFFKDARGSSEAGVAFFQRFLKENDLEKRYEQALKSPGVDKKQFLFLIQRLLYYDENEVKQMIIEASRHDLSRYRKYTKLLGTVDFFVRSVQKYKPWTVVFMYETNIPTALDDKFDVNYPFLEIARPLLKIYGETPAYQGHLFDIQNLKNVNTEILLVGGTLDQVAPISELVRIYQELPQAKLAVFEAYHCLAAPKEARNCRNKLANLFFLYGSDSRELIRYLEDSRPGNKFIKFYESCSERARNH